VPGSIEDLDGIVDGLKNKPVADREALVGGLELSVIAAGEAGGRYGLRELIKTVEAVECCRGKGIAAGRGTKFAGSRAGLLLPEMPGISKLTSTSGLCPTWLIGTSAGLPGLNLVAPTNDNTLVEVLTCAGRQHQADRYEWAEVKLSHF